MVSHATTLPPISGEYALGDIVRDASGNMFACVGAGTPGVWRKLAGPQTAGQLHLLPSPQQAAETRSGLGVAGTAPIPIGGSVTVNVGSTVPSVPAGATGVIGTIGAFAPSGPRFTASGNLAVVAGGAGPAGLAVTFLTGNDFAASLYVSALSAARTLSVFSYGSSAHVSMDVIGYFR